MALMHSTMMALGTAAPDFSLPDVAAENAPVQLYNYARAAEATLVMFVCNHCPYVVHVVEQLTQLARDYQPRGLKLVAVSSNDAEAYPADGPEEMTAFAKTHGFTFPYCYDESQEVARAYDAVCTPDFFVFDRELELAYRGRLDESRPKSGKPVTGEDMRRALDLILDGKPVPEDMQTPSAGCSIKWK